MLSGNDSVRVYTLGSATNHRFQVLAEIRGLEIGVQFGGQMVPEILGVFGVVVASDTPRVLVFGEIAGDELDGVEGVCFTGLSGRKYSAADRLFGDLCSGKRKKKLVPNFLVLPCLFVFLSKWWTWWLSGTYVVAVDLLLTNLLHQVVDPVLCRYEVVGEDLLVQSTGVLDDQSHVATDIPEISQGSRHVSIADDLVVTRGHGIVDTAGGQTGVSQLVPPTDIDEGVGEPQLADLVVDNLFLYSSSRLVCLFLFSCSLLHMAPLVLFRTSSRSHITPPGGATVMKPQGMNRLTPTALAALANGI